MLRLTKHKQTQCSVKVYRILLLFYKKSQYSPIFTHKPCISLFGI
ncbi:hypothetical protein HCCG_00835 [Helicobacter cinaedi CCUG 18818 = ATCC BAA-847]|uniref:Uncharacterized protein n=1 Tax=Helicobacter cinaedi CCUG 18818 = ATCC BAA-847 TaxID=537971 RepID=A0ABN0B9L4_9HELI|nr:hypothetical protein HCCG_00835 [Helicobacter cinaedi CCUG 18818 = ATCC BAA-847]